MIDSKILRDSPEHIKNASKAKNIEIDTKHILEIDRKYKELASAVQKLREERNEIAGSVAKADKDKKESIIEKGKKVKDELDKKEAAYNAVKEELDMYLLKIPNPAKPDVKVGKDDSENDVIRKHGTPKKFSFTPKDHVTLGEALDIIDIQHATNVSGARFAYLKNEGALLEFALVQLAFETLLKEGFTPVIPPVLIKKETMQKLGYMENGGDEDMFEVTKDNLMLVGTAEHTLASMHMGETLQSKDLPLRYVGFSSSFRREAGSYGKDTKGIIRVHQFDKVEMVSLVPRGEDDKEHEFLLSLEEKLFQALEIPYQVIKMCTGDLGFPIARKYDIEAWVPSQDKYREVTSASTATDFQARRLHIRYKDGDTTEYVNILNGTAFAIGRTIVAILENYQQEDGSIEIPKVLQKYIGKEKISRT